MKCRGFWKILIPMLLVLGPISVLAKKQKSSVVTDKNEIKEFKKLLRMKTNVMVLFINEDKYSQHMVDVFQNTADAMKGQATLVIIQCSNGNGKKLCKKLKIASDKPYYIKHYKDGEFHKDYDRSETISSMSNFLRDPTGDLPWEEDPTATDIYHLLDAEALIKFLKKGVATQKNAMIMFYAPWCGYCKSMKPEYVQAAIDLKGEAYLAAIDVAKLGNSKIRQLYNITGFPTLYYYEKGQFRFPYNGDNKRQAMVDFMRDPTAKVKSKKDDDMSWSEDSDVVHLSGENFDTGLKRAEHALVVFYAPWCGHCKRIKPEFEKAAARVKAEGIKGVLAAVDATEQPDLASRFGVKGYPTLKYFYKGEYKFDAGHARKEEQIVKFIKDPQEPPPPPPPEKPWAEEPTAVRHLDSTTFRSTLRKIKHALVMFYAPWCGHCKSTKPEFVKAAERFADELMVAFGAVDCTTAQDLCRNYQVTGYPTLKYLSYFDKKVVDYNGGRKEPDFFSYIHTQMEQTLNKQATTAQEAGFGGSVKLGFDSDFEKIISSPTPTFVMFFASWCSHCTAVKPIFSRIATKFSKGPVQTLAVDAAENPKVADIASIETLPTFKIFANGKVLEEFTGERSEDNMMAFCKKHAKVNDEL